MEKIRSEYAGAVNVELLLGGLRPGTEEPMPSAQRQQILHHWQAVHRMTRQPFRFEGALPEGFIYDTEPASRAVVAVSMLEREAIFTFFGAVQSAFYVGQEDVTHPIVLGQLAASVGLEAQQFLETFQSDAARNLTQAHFRGARQWDVHGFPAVIGQRGASLSLLAGGYCPFEALSPKIRNWLETGESVR